MAFVSLLLSFVAKKIGSIVQAIFGWSVTALFGRLPGQKQLAVSIALLLSIAWPVFVLGLFLPGVAAWALAFLPAQKLVGTGVLRIVWGVLAFVSPLVVGALTHWAAPSAKGGTLRALCNGYPLAVGYFVAFLITVVTVPLVKLASFVRGWADEHVYVQPRVGSYDKVLRELAEACARAGLLPEITDVPMSMALSTNALKLFAAGVVSPIVAEQVKRIRAEGVELYLYPSDLLVRGDARKVALVRAMLTRTEIDGDAYLVASPAGQCLQDELHRLIEVARTHESRATTPSSIAKSRLVAIWHEMNAAKLPFEEWVMLESIARRVERRLVREQVGAGAMPLDEEEDELGNVARQANAELSESPMTMVSKQEMTDMDAEMTPSERNPAILDEEPTTTLVREVMDGTKELVKLEIELAKEEAKEEIAQLKHAAIAFGIAAGASVMVLCVLTMAIVLALGGTAVAALAVAGAFVAIGGGAAWIGYGMLPKKPLEKTRQRLQTDMNQLKEHIA